MPIDPRQAAMAKGLQAQRGGAPPEDMMEREAPEAQAPEGMAEVKTHLVAALEILNSMGG